MRIHHRPAAMGAIRAAGGIPIGMEDFGSDTERGDHRSMQEAGNASNYLVLVGFRYGSCVPGKDLSITELEYETALQQDTPILAYLASERPEEITGVKATFPAGSLDTEGDSPAARAAAERLGAFRARLERAHTCSYFTNVAGLTSQITRDVQRQLAGGSSDGQRRLKSGYDALLRGDLTTAQLDLQLALLNLPEHSHARQAARARFLLGLVLLGGRRPAAVTITVFREAESQLRSAIAIEERPSYAITLAAVLLDYARNGLAQYADEARRLLARAAERQADLVDQRNLNDFSRCQPALARDLGL
jgi:hypothetical protein